MKKHPRLIVTLAMILASALALPRLAQAGLSGPPSSYLVPTRDGKHLLIMLSPVPIEEDAGNLGKLPTGEDLVIDALKAKVLELVRRRMEVGPAPFPFPAIEQHKKASKKSKSKAATGETIEEIVSYLEALPGPDHVADLVSCAVLTSPMARQTILSTLPLEDRLKHLVHFLMAEIEQYGKGKKD